MPASMVLAIFGIGTEDVFFNPYVRLYGSNDIVARFGAVGLLGKQITGEEQLILLVSAF